MRTGVALVARVGLMAGLGASLSACLMPTPFSAVSMGADAVSFMATGKAATDHGLSLAMGEDCALIRIFDGPICRAPVVYEASAAGIALEPLPDRVDAAQLAGAHPEVRAAIVRAAQYDGWRDGGTQIALLPGGFVADDIGPDAPPAAAEHGVEVAAAGRSLGDLFSGVAEGWLDAADEPSGGPFGRPIRSWESFDAQEALWRGPQGPAPTRTAANREIGERPQVAVYGRLRLEDAAALAQRLPALRNREIGG